MTISELALAGVASILVPYPYAVDDHQTYNAKYLSDKGAAILIKQNEFNRQSLAIILKEMDREKALEMAVKAMQAGVPESTKKVTEACLEAGKYNVN